MNFHFLFVFLCYCDGLGIVWRYPYISHLNGGSVFFIPYTIMVILVGFPLMFMELYIGQLASSGPVATDKRFSRLFKDLRCAMVFVDVIVMQSFNYIIAWALYHILASFGGGSSLSWSHCEPLWNSSDCIDPIRADWCIHYNDSNDYKLECWNLIGMEMRDPTIINISAKHFENREKVEEIGSINLELAVCILFAWLIVFLCIWGGIQNSRIVIYFTVLLPYVILTVFLAHWIWLHGASKEFSFYFTPEWSRLRSSDVWVEATVQVFFSLGLSQGGLITLSLCNKFNDNCFRKAMIVAICNVATSFFSGFVTFSVIGFFTDELAEPVPSADHQGANLVVARLPLASGWSLLYFLMLFTLGLNSQLNLMETVMTAILDEIPKLRNFKTWVVFVISLFGGLGGIIFTTNAGGYWLQLMNKYAANSSVLLIAIIDCSVFAWVYGLDQILNDIQPMIEQRGRCFRFVRILMWVVVTAAVLLFILYWAVHEQLYSHTIHRKSEAAIGWFVGLSPIFIFIVSVLCQLKSPKEQMSRNDDDEEQGIEARSRESIEHVEVNEEMASFSREVCKLSQTLDEQGSAFTNDVTPTRTLTHTLQSDDSSDAMRDTLTFHDVELMMEQPTNASQTTQQFPDPSILKNAVTDNLMETVSGPVQPNSQRDEIPNAAVECPRIVSQPPLLSPIDEGEREFPQPTDNIDRGNIEDAGNQRVEAEDKNLPMNTLNPVDGTTENYLLVDGFD